MPNRDDNGDCDTDITMNGSGDRDHMAADDDNSQRDVSAVDDDVVSPTTFTVTIQVSPLVSKTYTLSSPADLGDVSDTLQHSTKASPDVFDKLIAASAQNPQLKAWVTEIESAHWDKIMRDNASRMVHSEEFRKGVKAKLATSRRLKHDWASGHSVFKNLTNDSRINEPKNLYALQAFINGKLHWRDSYLANGMIAPVRATREDITVLKILACKGEAKDLDNTKVLRLLNACHLTYMLDKNSAVDPYWRGYEEADSAGQINHSAWERPADEDEDMSEQQVRELTQPHVHTQLLEIWEKLQESEDKEVTERVLEGISGLRHLLNYASDRVD